VLNAQWHEAANFPRRHRRAIAQDIADHIRRRIVTGDLQTGQRLPAIPKLARLFGVSPPTAQAAIHILRALGFIRVSHGNGTYVAHPRIGAATLSHAFQNASVRELAAMRAMIDQQLPVVAAAAVRSRGSRTTARIPAPLRDIGFLSAERALARHLGPERYLRADAAFHEEIIRSVHGMEIVRDVYHGIVRRLEPWALATADLVAVDPTLDELHRRMSVAVIGGRPVEAARLARAIARREEASTTAVLG